MEKRGKRFRRRKWLFLPNWVFFPIEKEEQRVRERERERERGKWEEDGLEEHSWEAFLVEKKVGRSSFRRRRRRIVTQNLH